MAAAKRTRKKTTKAVGRPPYKPKPADRSLVKGMAMGGYPHRAIAAEVGISVNTLRKHLHAELTAGGAQANARVVNAAFRMASSGSDWKATQWWLACHMGWHPGMHQSPHLDEDGAESPITVVVNPSGRSIPGNDVGGDDDQG